MHKALTWHFSLHLPPITQPSSSLISAVKEFILPAEHNQLPAKTPVDLGSDGISGLGEEGIDQNL